MATFHFFWSMLKDKKQGSSDHIDRSDIIKQFIKCFGKDRIEYVVGDEWYGGNLSYHLESRPKWISINDKKAYELIKSKDRMSGAMSLENIYPALIIGSR